MPIIRMVVLMIPFRHLFQEYNQKSVTVSGSGGDKNESKNDNECDNDDDNDDENHDNENCNDKDNEDSSG